MTTKTYEDAYHMTHTLTLYERRAQLVDTGMTSFPHKKYYRRIWWDECGDLYAIIGREVWVVSAAPWIYGYIAQIPVGFTTD